MLQPPIVFVDGKNKVKWASSRMFRFAWVERSALVRER